MEEGNGYNSHNDKIIIDILCKAKLIIKCVSELTPLDMINLYNGTDDATGNQIWLGAYLFLHAFVINNHENLNFICKESFCKKKVIELGCGTGISGISILLKHRPYFVHLTDFDSSTLKLCDENCSINLSNEFYTKEDCHINDMVKQHNNKDKSHYAITQLTWWESKKDHNHTHLFSRYDTVIATDILYDISSLSSILTTAYDLLVKNGHFILSHVPRCSFEEGSSSSKEVICNTFFIEELIYKKAIDVGFCRNIRKIRPLDIMHDDASFVGDHESNSKIPALQEMQDIDAAIFIFEKIN